MRLILHADDFGSSADTVRATIDCFEREVLTSASIMPRMPATEHAIEFAHAHPELDFGVHLTFVGDDQERPLMPPDQIPALANPTGRFRRTRNLRIRALLRRLPVEQIERELVCQLDAVQGQGIEITHVDSHRHMHKLPSFAEALQRVLPRFGIRRVRAVQDIYLGRPLTSPTYWLGSRWQRRLTRSFVTTDHFYMPTSTSDIGWEHPLLAIAERLDGTTLEVGVHPGSSEERSALVRFAALARGAGHDFIAWKDIA
jgi:predicted glycoside hydrolase/deacetylase ChbG (UPF0249 family)